MRDFVIEDDNLYIVMDFARGRDLYKTFLVYGKLPEEGIRIVSRQMFSALEYLVSLFPVMAGAVGHLSTDLLATISRGC